MMQKVVQSEVKDSEAAESNVSSSAHKAIQSVTIDGKSYPLDKLSKDVQQQLANIRMADQELLRLQAQFALVQTARSAYVQVLKAELAQLGE